MPEIKGKTGVSQGGHRLRKRLRGMLDTRTGRSLSIAGAAAPIIGLIAHDLQKPDSVIRGLISSGIRKLITGKDRLMVGNVRRQAEITINEENN